MLTADCSLLTIHLNRPRRQIPRGRLPGKQLPPVADACIAVQSQQGRRFGLSERHLAAVERLHPAADRLQDRLLAGPGPEERRRPGRRREGMELVALAAAEESADQ